ncbi:hypothetical protein WCN79_04210 [Xanthomonas axonopodis pv. vasculorum]|uniref:hypothetical protein n=1 Tax=Xanthomonas axonopodis TaxID=53413 RepID=UPI0004D931AD|nr:hypothetical protein [Xanthomonas axonopodis]QKD88028.1 hypothetical protein XAV_19020 [Xanthomonas axonopodis pv. vasculorum]
MGSNVRGVPVSAVNVRQVRMYLYQAALGGAGSRPDDSGAEGAERSGRMLGQARLNEGVRLA